MIPLPIATFVADSDEWRDDCEQERSVDQVRAVHVPREPAVACHKRRWIGG